LAWASSLEAAVTSTGPSFDSVWRANHFPLGKRVSVQVYLMDVILQSCVLHYLHFPVICPGIIAQG